MFFFGHLGFGYKLASPWKKGLPKKALLLGTILPDLIDKPLYYGLVFLTGKRGADLGIIAGTRTFGHTALFLLTLTLAALIRKSRWLAALALGVATHLLLDNLGDRLLLGASRFKMTALFWPFLGWRFPVMPFANWEQHVGHVAYDPYLLWTEGAGLLILLWEYWKARRRGEILLWIRHSRSQTQRWKYRSRKL